MHCFICLHTYMHIHAYVRRYPYIRKYTHTCIRPYACTDIHTPIPPCVHTQTCMHTYIHTHRQTDTSTHACIRTHSYIQYVHPHTQDTYAYIQSLHTYMSVLTYIHTRISARPGRIYLLRYRSSKVRHSMFRLKNFSLAREFTVVKETLAEEDFS